MLLNISWGMAACRLGSVTQPYPLQLHQADNAPHAQMLPCGDICAAASIAAGVKGTRWSLEVLSPNHCMYPPVPATAPGASEARPPLQMRRASEDVHARTCCCQLGHQVEHDGTGVPLPTGQLLGLRRPAVLGPAVQL